MKDLSQPNMAEKDKGTEKKLMTVRAAVRGDMAVVEIGPQHVKYCIHTALLAQHSEYFQRALNGPWKEAREGVVTLEDIDCETFDIFVEWLYTQNLPTSADQWLLESYKDKDENSDWEQRYDILRVKVCIFGDRFLAEGFRRAVHNDLVDMLIRAGERLTDPAIKYAFDHLRSDNPLLQMLVDMQCLNSKTHKRKTEDGALEDLLQLPGHFLSRVILRYIDIVHGAKNTISPCDYHDHATEEERKKCGEE